MLKLCVLALLLLGACQPVPSNDSQTHDALLDEKATPTLPNNPSSPLNLQTVRNVLPLTGASFCEGIDKVLKTAKQEMKDEAAAICNGATPTPLLAQLWAAPYEGVGDPVTTPIRVVPIDEQTSEIFLAYAMRAPKKAVKTLLGEEKHAIVSYDSGNTEDPMKMAFKFKDPPVNSGDCDTAFTLEQLVQVRTAVDFDDTSLHELKLYLMQPNNFDFFMAGRTLVAPTEQFKRSVVLRGFMTDPNDASKTISTTILHFIMNSREQHERMVAAFMEFIKADMLKLYNEQKS